MCSHLDAHTQVQGLNEAVSLVRSAGKRVVVATPRVLKPEEDRMWRFYVKLGADALLVRRCPNNVHACVHACAQSFVFA